MIKDLEERVRQFRSGKLWGQPKPMHMGTYHLVNDLWAEIKRVNIVDELKSLSKIVSEVNYCGKCGRDD